MTYGPTGVVMGSDMPMLNNAPGPAVPMNSDGSIFPWVLQATTTTPTPACSEWMPSTCDASGVCSNLMRVNPNWPGCLTSPSGTNAILTGGAQAPGVVAGAPMGTNPVAVAVGAPTVPSGISTTTLLIIGVAVFFLFNGGKK